MTAQATVEITNKRGLHARASAKFVKLAAGLGCCIDISAEGPEAETAVEALKALVEGRFDEGE